jgi:epoxyqueuosine reductase QueG
VPSGISKRLYRQFSQDVCPWNEKFSRALPEGSPFAARDAIAGKDARTLARELLAMTREEFSERFRNSPMKRAKRRGLARNAAVALGNVGATDDVPALEAALSHDEPLVREHAASALAELRRRRASIR